jgi:hypothetical protein
MGPAAQLAMALCAAVFCEITVQSTWQEPRCLRLIGKRSLDSRVMERSWRVT